MKSVPGCYQMFPGGQNCPGIENYCTNLFLLAHWKRKKNSLSVYCHIDRYQAPSLKWVAYCRTRVNGKWISGQNPQLLLQFHRLYPEPVRYLPFPPCGPTHSQNAVGRPAGPPLWSELALLGQTFRASTKWYSAFLPRETRHCVTSRLYSPLELFQFPHLTTHHQYGVCLM